MFPSMLGSRGRAYLMLFILSVLYRGPVSNIQRNVEAAALSLSCNLDLQVQHSRLLWREAVKPFVLITQQLVDGEAAFRSEAESSSSSFQNIRDEVVHQFGYDRFGPEAGGSTQDQFTAKTIMQCDSVVDEGVQRCADWFSQKWAECMTAIPVPVINHILCVSMKFHFLCDIMRVMTPWCREQIPVEGNFGQLFDRLNLSVDLLSREFSTSLVLQEEQQQSVLGGAVLEEEFTQAVRGSFLKLTAAMEEVLRLLQLLLSFSFITIFTQGFRYLLQYRRDILFDNLYITTYFRQIDARRRRAGQRCILPLRRSEKKNLIDPWSLKVHEEERGGLSSGVLQLLSVSLLSLLLVFVDVSLVHVLDIVSTHTFTQFNLTSSHKVDIRVGGASMMARLLRKTVSAFNSSSILSVQTDNKGLFESPPEAVCSIPSCSGIIAFNASLSLELQPQEDQQGGEGGAGGVHLLFSSSPLEGDSARGCGVSPTVPPLRSSAHTQRRRRDILSETKHIELVLVADHQEFLNYQRNNRTLVYRLLDVANQVDWFYRPLNVRVALTGLEIWTDRDKIRVEKSPTETLNHFLEWRTRELLPRLQHDNAQLVMGGSFDGTTVGMASQSSMCSRDRSGGVNVDHLVSVLGVASTVAHELGHNLGMSHDTAERRCSCQNERRLGGCIMEPSTGFLPGQLFSSCSAADLSASLLQGGGMCLFNVPQPDLLLGGPRCGNLYTETGEQCDCGLLEECEDLCCNASTCQLVPGAQCSSDGICCHDCKLRAAGSVCRNSLGECDLPEFCTGSAPYCPPNVFLHNGQRCEADASFCYEGVCVSMQAQCQRLWGPNATRAPPVCFSSVNKQGNKYGNCGQLTNGSYTPCGDSDVHCGRVQCRGGSERPLLGTNAEILTTKVRLNHSDLVCRGTFFHLGDDVLDPATVAPGTACGPGKACLNQKCQNASVFGVEDCHRKCTGHGVCNSNQNCHCEVGWAPPDCRYSGHGGSVDSGPARAGGSDPVRVALLVLFLFILPVLLLFLTLSFPRVRQKFFCLGTTEGRVHKSRTPVTEREDGRNGEQVRPLRYHLNPPTDIPLTPPPKEVHDRPAPPTKPLPPDPALKPPPQLLGSRPAPPNKPLPLDPLTPGQAPAPSKPVVAMKPRLLPPPPHPGFSAATKTPQHRAVAPATGRCSDENQKNRNRRLAVKPSSPQRASPSRW
ncbi:disintegrin and metalloproteinase domain-containing protein 12-like [Pseudoliparis swirei]|uniref:disintegrin and metalloproteinase domain-containing protein 12-like n=1 Tax=Pseudoliparis swirei TaxID=2059687 RepID=UPI0024BDE2AD|nr:disintegrin and metalloproteinase domain-containing protein 12-like [Pseudoliparis swirei]